MLKLCAKQAARERACERRLSRTSRAKTSRATTLNRKCNGCHFSKCSSQCWGVIFVLNNSKVVMIKISLTLISLLLIVLTISSSPVYAPKTVDEDLSTFTTRRDSRQETSFLFYVDSRSGLETCQTLTVDTGTAWVKTAILYLLTPIYSQFKLLFCKS